MSPPRFGLFLPQQSFEAAVDSALRAEAEGFDSVSINDHFVPQTGAPDTPQLECLTTLTAIAARTERIRLVPSVISASFRPPALLAKMVATIDRLSSGRFTLGIGAGWHRSEYEAHGYRFPPAAERLQRLEETIQILKAMWTQEDPCFQGDHLSVEHASHFPTTVQQPHVPIMIGGSSPALLAIAARHADIANLIPPTANGKDFLKDQAAAAAFDRNTLKRKIELLHALMDAEGRAVGDVELGGLAMLHVVDDEHDPSVDRLATRLGFAQAVDAKRSPVALIGTVAEIRDEIHERMADTGVTYTIVVPTSERSRQRFVDEVLVEFASATA